MKKNKLFSNKARISYLEIFILILASVSFSYLISDNVVNAQTVTSGCCEKTKTGALCQNVDSLDKCDANYKRSPNDCGDDTDYCELGCCVSSVTGNCNVNTPKANCPEEEFFDSSDCRIQECKKGCCILGDSAEFITEKNCQVKSGFKGLAINFSKEYNSEIKCIFSVDKAKSGACLLDEQTRKCKYTTLEECNIRLKIDDEINNNFFIGKFCSDQLLNTSCTSKHHKSCIAGKEDVYWLDSCDNPEDVAEDCDLFKSTYCGKSGESYICEDISCDTKNGKKKNGESWCEYDEVIGNGKDMAGSRQVRHICYMGEEKIEPCSDYRNEICVEESVSYKNDKISQSACRVNNWRSCMYYNTFNETEMTVKCNENPDCFVKDINIDTQFKFKVCTNNYPPGFDLTKDELNLTSEYYQNPPENPNDNLCNLATQTCTVVEVCGFFGCSIKVNKNCLDKKFTEEMNEFCVSLGDCGGYVNYNNDVTQDGYIITTDRDKKPPRLSDSDILSLKNKAGKKPANPGDMDFLGALGNPDNLENLEDNKNSSFLQRELQAIKGAMGSALLIKILSDETRGNSISKIAEAATPGVVDYSKFSNAFASIKAGIIVDYKLSKIFGVPSTALIAGAIGGIIGTLVLGLIPGLIIGLILFFLFFGTVRYTHITFKCLPWQPPINGNCEKCNQDLFCTDYRCSSLGQSCEVINKGTGNELCVSKKINASVPVIKPWQGIITQGYEYFNTKDDGFEIVNSSDKACIPEFTDVKFGIQTLNTDGSLQYTQCKFDMDASKTYEEMVDYFDENHPNSYLPYHRRTITLPSPEALKTQFNVTPEIIKKLGELKFFIRCKNLKGTENPNPFQVKVCVKPGPDLTPPYIKKTIPENNAKLKYGTTEEAVSFFINEPANCKWDKDDKTYEEMENQMVCDNDLESYTLYGFKCDTTLKGLFNNSNFFVKCQDLADNKNNMSDSYSYNLFVSESELKITSMAPAPGQKFSSGIEPFKITLRLETAGGAENGKAICEWQGNGFGPDTFTETDSIFHTYNWKYAMRGGYNLNFKCVDSSGNIAENYTYFTLFIDDTPPKMTRVYSETGLKIITDEKAECRYSFNKSFVFENATLMSGNEIEHTAEWKLDNYNIQCKDVYGNKGGIIKITTRERA